MGLTFVTPLITIAIVIAIGFAVAFIFKNKSNISVMLLGLSIIITGGIIAVDPSSNLNGIEYLLIFIGLAFVIGGFAKKENKELL